VFENLVGGLENEFFEAKGEPWDLNTERGKLDLAKDITALANLRGGIIIVGAATTDSPTYQRQEIQEIRFLPASIAQIDRYLHIISKWVYPVPEGLDVRWYSDPKAPSRGIMSVHIPEQVEEMRPFLVAHYLTEGGKRIDAIVGLVQRFGATTKPTPVEELHVLLREGRRMDLIHQKLDAIIAKIEGAQSPIQK
jgi:hypothetical protein